MADKAMIIKKESLPLFIDMVAIKKTTKEYWEECEKARTVFTDSEIEEMKRWVALNKDT